jgi:hypothetical protein
MGRRKVDRFLLSILATATPFASAVHASEILQVAEQVPFRDELLISKAVIEECDLPRMQLQALSEEAASRGFELLQRQDLASIQTGKVLAVEIVRADSMRQGAKHVKQMAVAGKLFENGEQIGSFVAQRRSSGGMFGKVMTSCAVLHKCARSIAADISKWLTSPTLGAQLGERRHRLPIEP